MSSAAYTSRVVGTYLLMFGLTFGVAASVNKRSLLPQIKNTNAWISTICVQFVLLPAIGFGVSKALRFDFASSTILLLITTSPGGGFSNWFCTVFNGDVALSVQLTAMSTLISMVMIPCNIIMYTINSNDETHSLNSVDWGSLYLSLSVVLVAVILGLLVSIRLDSTPFNDMTHWISYIFGILILLFTVLLITYDDTFNINLFGQPWVFYIGVALPCLASLCVSLLFTWSYNMAQPECVSVAIECFYQNVSIAAALAVSIFEGDKLSDVLAICMYYGIVQFMVVIIFCIVAWKQGWTKAPKDDNLWLVLVAPYQMLELEQFEKRHSSDADNDARVISDGNGLNVVDEFVVNALADDNLESPDQSNHAKMKTHTKDSKADVYTDDANFKTRRSFFFRNKAKVMDADAPTISPTSVLSSETFAHTPKNRDAEVLVNHTSENEGDETLATTSNRFGNFMRKMKVGGQSNAVKRIMVDEKNNKDDSLSEDPDISIAGESDLESGLSVSAYGDEISLSGFPANRFSTRGGGRGAKGAGKRHEDRSEPSARKDNDTRKNTSNIAESPLAVIVDTSLTEEHFDEISLNENATTPDLQHNPNR